MKKAFFEEPEFQIIRFSAKDVVVAESEGLDKGDVEGPEMDA